MKKIMSIVLIGFLFFTGCSSNEETTSFKLEMDLSEDYDDQEPFVDERLFYVSENVDELKIEFAINFEGLEGILEIADNNTKEVLWRDTWDETTKDRNVVATLNNIDKDLEYVISFTGRGIKNTKIDISSDNEFIKERVKPEKS